MDNETYADFISYYRDNTENEESYKPLWKLNKEYTAEDARLERQHGTRLQSLDLKMDDIGKSKTLDTTNARNATFQEYKSKADDIARQHGFKGLSYDEHMKQKEKEASHERTGKVPSSPTPAEPQPEAKQPEVSQTDRELKRQAVLEEIKQITERNRSQNRDRNR